MASKPTSEATAASEQVAVEIVKAGPAAESPAAPTMRAVDHARAAGMLPKSFPGPRLRPSIENPKAWLYDAAKLRGLDDEDQITQQDFDQRIADVSTVLVR